MKEMIEVMQDVLNSEEIKNKYCAIFGMLSPEDKVNFQMWIIYKLAETNEEIRNALAKHVYERLRA